MTVDELRELLNQPTVKEYDNNFIYKNLLPRILCKDGESLSVQASNHHYCDPRRVYAKYTTVEVGFPSCRPPDSWEQYFDYGSWEEKDPTDSVYGHIPIGMVVDFINLHKGFDRLMNRHEDKA
jgi:hypothetical protein